MSHSREKLGYIGRPTAVGDWSKNQVVHWSISIRFLRRIQHRLCSSSTTFFSSIRYFYNSRRWKNMARNVKLARIFVGTAKNETTYWRPRTILKRVRQGHVSKDSVTQFPSQSYIDTRRLTKCVKCHSNDSPIQYRRPVISQLWHHKRLYEYRPI